MFGKDIHSRIYFVSLACLAASLPLSIFATSVFQVVLIVNWLLEGRFDEKWSMFRSRPSVWLLISIYVVFVAGLICTRDFDYAFHDLKIKLPLLILGLVMGTSPALTQEHLKWVLLSLAAGVFAGSMASIAALTGKIDVEYKDMREISLFVSHIRFSLLINVSIFTLAYMVFKPEYIYRKWELPLYLVIMVWLVIFLFILQSITGIIVFLIVSFSVFWVYLHRVWSMALRWILSILMLSAVVLGVFLVSKSMRRFYRTEHFDRNNIELVTAGGRPYVHDFDSPFIENGNFIWLYLCEPELRKEWNRLSDLDYDGKDGYGNSLKFTLIRYLTSLGFHKDSVGVNSLNAKDIRAIEEGKANYLYAKRWSLYAKVYELLWQIDVYRKGGNPSGHSITQRIVYLEAALNIIRENFWFGVGTGDVVNAYAEYYERTDSELSKRWRLRAHNQFLTFWLTYGIFGFFWILFAFIYSPVLEKKQKDYLIWMFMMVALLSWLNEDTLETHTGVSFFAFFYVLFVFGSREKSD